MLFTTTKTSIKTRAGMVDLVAVERFVRGAPVQLETAERPVAVWAGIAAGLSASEVTKRLRCSNQYVKTILAAPPPTDWHGQPLVDIDAVLVEAVA